MAIRFVLNGSLVEVRDAPPHRTLLQWLRANGFSGSKEGCAEGECGACAVALLASAPGENGSHFEPVNSCLLPLHTLAGREVVSIEGVAPPGGLHPVQEAMVAAGGSQCGYCTPGFVVSLFCEYYRPGRSGFDPESISGNLCRCTGYRPIADVARSMPHPGANDERLIQLRRPTAPVCSVADPESGFFRPTSLTELWGLVDAHPNAPLVAGGTDLLVYANQRHERWPALISVEAVAELLQLSQDSTGIVLGSALPLSRIEHWLATEGTSRLRALEQLLPLFSSRLIRNRATLGGNLATASPIGDSAPVLMALGATVELSNREGRRAVPLGEFFTGYRRTVLSPGEVIRAVHVPLPTPQHQAFYKVSKRVLDDISTVAAAFALSLDARGSVERFGVAFGGIAATPILARSLESVALGRTWDEETLALLVAEAAGVGTPQSDFRGSAAYRRAMIERLIEKFFWESQARMEAAQ